MKSSEAVRRTRLNQKSRSANLPARSSGLSVPSSISRKKSPEQTDPELLAQLQLAIGSIDTALNHFEQVVDPTLIDCYIYELKAAQLRYQFLLRRIKSQEPEQQKTL